MKYLALKTNDGKTLFLTPKNEVIYLNTDYSWEENKQETKNIKPLEKKEWDWALKNWGKNPIEIDSPEIIKNIDEAIAARKLYFSNISGKTFSIGGNSPEDNPFAKLAGLIK